MFNKEKCYYSSIKNKCCNGRLVFCVDENNNYFLQCDDCYTAYYTPEDVINYNVIKEFCHDDFAGRFATLEEIKALGWDKYLKNNKKDK